MTRLAPPAPVNSGGLCFPRRNVQTSPTHTIIQGVAHVIRMLAKTNDPTTAARRLRPPLNCQLRLR